MERPDDVDKPRWTAKLGECGPQALTTNCIKSLGQIYKEDVQVLVLLSARFLDLSYGKDHVDCPSLAPGYSGFQVTGIIEGFCGV